MGEGDGGKERGREMQISTSLIVVFTTKIKILT